MPDTDAQSFVIESHEPPIPVRDRLRLQLSGLNITALGFVGAYAGWNALSARVVTPDDRVMYTFMLCGGIAIVPAGVAILWSGLSDKRGYIRIDHEGRRVSLRRTRRMLWSSRIVQEPERTIKFSEVCGIERHWAGRTQYLDLVTPDRVEPLGSPDQWSELAAVADQLLVIAREQEMLGNDSLGETKRRRRSVQRDQLLGGLLAGALLCLICWALFQLLAGPAVP